MAPGAHPAPPPGNTRLLYGPLTHSLNLPQVLENDKEGRTCPHRKPTLSITTATGQ